MASSFCPPYSLDSAFRRVSSPLLIDGCDDTATAFQSNAPRLFLSCFLTAFSLNEITSGRPQKKILFSHLVRCRGNCESRSVSLPPFLHFGSRFSGSLSGDVAVFGQDKQANGPMRFVLSSVKDGLSLSTAYFVSLPPSQGVQSPPPKCGIPNRSHPLFRAPLLIPFRSHFPRLLNGFQTCGT